jgi:transposase-like protein
MASLVVVLCNVLAPWMEEHGVQPTMVMFVGAILVGVITRKAIRVLLPIRCPRCGEVRCYEVEGRTNRFTCRNCGKVV